jgi:hypothetical protein
MRNATGLVLLLLLSLTFACSNPPNQTISKDASQSDSLDVSGEVGLDLVGRGVVDVAVIEVVTKDVWDALAVDFIDVALIDLTDVVGEVVPDVIDADIPDSTETDTIDVVETTDVPEELEVVPDLSEDLEPEDIEGELPPCEPNCDGTLCGGDGCGGSCECPENHECVEVPEDGITLVCLFTCEYVCAELTGCGKYSLHEDISCECGGCDDGDTCTDDHCEMDNDGIGSCAFPANVAPCDDGNPCTGPDLCSEGQCTGALKPIDEINFQECLCQEDADCDPLDDGNSCNGILHCGKEGGGESGFCQTAPDSIPEEGAPCGGQDSGTVCKAQLCVCDPDCNEKECGSDGCQGSCGECDWTQDCTAGLCVIKDCGFLCDGIQCGSVGPAGECLCGTCDDGDDCTVDSCDEDAASCVFDEGAGIGLECDDNQACTDNDVCTDQGCEGDPKVCADENECTLDSCHPITGECQFTTGQLFGKSCNDENPCTSGDKCNGGECVGIPKSPLVVNVEECACDTDGDCAPWDDGDVCSGSLVCLDGDLGGFCSIDPASLLDCNDNVNCTADSCHPTEGCKHFAMTIQCTDQASCTVDSCDPELGCLNLPDNSKCDDGNPCTYGFCHPQNSCTYGAVPEGFPCGDPIGWGKCSQNGVCTCAPACKENGCGDDGCGGSCGSCGEWGYDCIDGECVADCELWCQVPECGLAANGECDCGNCDDGSECTLDICKPDASCLHIYHHDAPCDDGSECTADDHCVMAACLGTLKDCDNGSACTVDSCDPATGKCLHASDTTDGNDCDDGVPCTMSDKCAAGICLGFAKTCDDASVCTVDSCDAVTGECLHEVLGDGTVCDDDFECSLDDKCLAGKCVGQRPTAQNTPPGCGCITDEQCDDDGNICNGTLHCDVEDDKGVCVVAPDSLNPCDDGVECTDDLCSPEEGCSNPLVPGVCADDVECTSDYCHPIGGCSNIGWGANCDDGNECTSDTCNVPAGCSYTPMQNGTPCGAPDGWGQCQAGECSCKSKCAGLECGNDGCGGTCSDCPGEGNACIEGECQCEPDCSGKECGPNGCGGYCGGCDFENAECGEDFKCHCFNVECESICCAVQEECVDGYCQNLINPPPVRLFFGNVTPTTMEIIMVNDKPVSAISVNLALLGKTYVGGGLAEEYLPFLFEGTTLFIGLGIGATIPVGEGVLLNVEFTPKKLGDTFCLIGDYNNFAGPDGGLEYQAIPPCYTWE